MSPPSPDAAQPPEIPVGRPSSSAAWWLALRPKTLSVSVAPVLVGSALAYSESGTFILWPALVAVLSAMLIQVGTNLHNDVSDFERGADTPDRLGPRVPRRWGGCQRPRFVVRPGAPSCWPSYSGSPWLRAAAWRSSSSVSPRWSAAGPIPMVHGRLRIRRWAKSSCLFFGLAAVGGSYYLQTLNFSPAAAIAAAMLGAFGAAVISVNNTRDLGTDARAGKNTLAVCVGRPAMNAVYFVEMLMPHALLPVPAGLLGKGWSLALPCLSAGMALQLCRRFVAMAPGAGFNDLLAATARLQAVYALLLALGLVL